MMFNYLEKVVDTEVVLGRRLKEDGVDLLGKLLTLLQRYCPLALQINLSKTLFGPKSVF